VTFMIVLVTALMITTYTTPVFAGEICNGKDDDGDTKVDEDFPMLGQQCWDGIGKCRESGKWVCGGEQLVTCKVQRMVFPEKEVCNGEDDDCDGLVDNLDLSITPSCYIESDDNLCNQGRLICWLGGSSPRCVPLPPTEEVCGNDIDENCDGIAEVCLPSGSSSGNGGDGGHGSSGLGPACRQAIFKEATCSFAPTDPSPLLPISAVVAAAGAVSLLVRRRRIG
jgi:MYXO-CTERM domain-containing protein